MRLGNAALLGIGIATLSWAWVNRDVTHPPGVIAPDTPVQTPLTDPTLAFSKGGFTIKPLAKFELQARVLSAAHYHFGRESDLAPVDLALGWGRMSDTQFLEKLSISQASRFYSYTWSNPPPLPPEEIIVSSANMHLIPAEGSIAHELSRVRTGQIVRLKGYLVRAEAPDGWHWTSSLTRTDTGEGACEVVWVEGLDVSG